MICPLCGEGQFEEKRAGYTWKCNMCDARLLADPEADSAEALWRSEQAYKYMISKKGGSSNSGNRMKRDDKRGKRREPPYMLE